MTSPGFPGFPRRPLLRPGALVTRRNDRELQVGLQTPLVVPDRPDVRAVLDGLRLGVAPSAASDLSPIAAQVCTGLLERGLVVDGDAWLAALDPGAPEAVRAGLTSVVADLGADAGRVLARRAGLAVLVDDDLPTAGDRLRHHLAAAGLGTARDDGADLVVLLRGTEPDRDEVDHWVRSDVPHVFLACVEGTLRLGPFVHPARTACLRCLDAHHTERDPRRSLVVQQYAEHRARPGDLPAPVPADLLDLATGYLARDITRWADGLRPTTWSTTVRVDGSLDLPRTSWSRHPGCGCAWDQALTG